MSEYLIGQEVEAFCRKCKSDTIHVITSISGVKIDKAMCKTCMSYHKIKLLEESVEKPVSRTAKPTAEVKTIKRPRRDKWTRLLDSTASEQAISYSMDKVYEVATAIHHKTFGLGVVKNIIDVQKIEVLFHDGAKILVQNYQG
ncbi:MAG: hypothetical protein ACOY90_19680 [Candidatus Zhuqueibacterota bacterium]